MLLPIQKDERPNTHKGADESRNGKYLIPEGVNDETYDIYDNPRKHVPCFRVIT